MAEQTVLLTGAAGLLGTWLRRTVPAGMDLVALVHRTPVQDVPEVVADLRDPDAVVAAVAAARPALVIHAAYRRDEASIVDATRNVVDAAEEGGAALLHVSSDAVFSGDGTLRREDDPPDPIWDYGRWKAAAEDIVRHGSPSSAIVRLPLVVSVDPDDPVVADVRAGAARGEPTAWFDDEVRQPAGAADLASAIWKLAALPPGERAGVWHLPGPEQLTRYEIARRVAAALGLRPEVVAAEPTPASAKRPAHLVLGATRAETQLGWRPSPVLR